MDAYSGARTSKKIDQKVRQVHNVEDSVEKGNQKRLTRKEVNALLATEQKKWEKAKVHEINEQNRWRKEKKRRRKSSKGAEA